LSAEQDDVAVVIPHFNRADLLATLLKHLAEQTYPIREITVVDNGSSDESVALAEEAGARVLRMGKNTGFAAAVNRGIEAAHTRWVVIMNNDVRMDSGWLSALMARVNAAGAWFATGKLLQAANPDRIDGAYDAISRGGAAWRCGHDRADGPLWSESRTIDFAPLTAALFRRELFDRVGLLDERFESYLEDMDLGLRCAAAGLRGVYAPEAVALHVGSATLGAWRKATVELIARNHILLLSKHFRGAPRWPALAAHVLWLMLAVRHRAGSACIRGTLQGLRKARLVAESRTWEKINAVVADSERQIYDLQRRTGFDWYWKAYFALVRS
jgi:GT2 family glycosyltransferase